MTLQLSPRRPIVVGLAGGIACGKSTCARMLAGDTGLVIDADAIIREIQTNPDIIESMEQLLGARLTGAQGGLDREAAARAAFDDPAKRRALEKLLHPIARGRIESALAQGLRAGEVDGVPDIIILDVPLLLETGLDARCDKIVYIDADVATRAERASRDRGWSVGDLAARESQQKSVDEKRARSDAILYNRGSIDDLAKEAARVRESLLGAAKPRK